MKNEYLYIMTAMLNVKYFKKFQKHFKKLTLERELEIIFNTISTYWDTYKDKEAISLEELFLLYKKDYPNISGGEVIESKIREMFTYDIDQELLLDCVANLVRQQTYADIITDCIKGEDSGSPEIAESISDRMAEMHESISFIEDSNPFYEPEISELISVEASDRGISWGIPSLDLYLGKCNGGTLGHVFARNDIGKTSFLSTISKGIARGLGPDEYILWANNEERKTKVRFRNLCCVTNMTKAEVSANHEEAARRWNIANGNAIKLFDASYMSLYDIESLLHRFNFRFVIIDIGDKVLLGGQYASNTDRLKALYARFRVLVKDFPHIDILTSGQASSEAVGQTWLLDNWMDNSKTGKPGELDYAIGIGGSKPESCEPVDRYIHLCKNKLGDGIHAQITMQMNPMTGRYYDI